MAPPPEYDKEPKAPDKSATNISCEDSKALHNLVNDQQTNSDNKSATAAGNTDVENKHVETLDDGQLRALLDEAITYKCPKDREGKSSLFKELLEEVEQDEQACEAAARGLSGGRSRRGVRGGGGSGRRALPHSNSLQDLVAALAAEPAPRRSRHHNSHHTSSGASSAASVSARAIHGGSLPSGVDTSFLMGEETGSRGGYLATVRCVNPPPLAERRVSASDAHCPADTELNRRSKPAFPMTYTARATLEIGSGSVGGGRAVTTTTASNQVDTAIPFSCITTPEVVASCNTTPSTAQAAVAVDHKPLQLSSSYRAVTSLTGGTSTASQADPAASAAAVPSAADTASAVSQPRSVISSSFNGLPLSRPNYGSTATTAPDEFKKSLDENGNAVHGFSSPLSGSSQHKKPRRKKSSKNEAVIKSHEIDGYQGNKDLNEVLRFIESNADNSRAHKLGRAKHKDDSDEKGGKKRSTERRKDKENKIKRATSMEELSRTKLEDLTDKPSKKERWTDGSAPAKAERRSWGDDARDNWSYRDDVTETVPDADFQTVTKKRKARRRADEVLDACAGEGRGRVVRALSPRARRVSAPPSDRSNDSNDDMDSVHSLPEPAHAAPAAHTHAPVSYADIARTRHNIPDLIESCNFYAEGGEQTEVRLVRAEVPPAPPDHDGYPALEARAHGRGTRPRENKPAPTTVMRRDRKQVDSCVLGECPAPDVVADRRPPVILLDSSARPRDMDGVTFGFDINEQLLGGPQRRPRCDLVRDAVEVESTEGGGATRVAGVEVRAGCTALRYVPPEPPPLSAHLHQIIDYVGTAWEDVVRCGGLGGGGSGGKVRYYAE